MGNYLKHIFRKALYLWSCLCVLLAAVSCVEEEPCDTCSKYPVKVQLNITAQEDHSLNALNTDEAGLTHEYINTLCVLLVKEGKVVKKMIPDLSSNALAVTGDLKEYLSEPFELEPGTYVVYAFANMSDVYWNDWSSFSSLNEGELLDNYPDLNDMVLEDPAGKLDFGNHKFIPMSFKQEVTIDASTRSLSIGLDRLVSKIRITGIPADVGIRSLTFGGCADGVRLFADGKSFSSISYEQEKTMNFTDSPSTLPDFYVNATEETGHPFFVELTTDEYSGVTYNAVTQRDELPRNSIFPLTLQLNLYGLDLVAQSWLSPIGSLPIEVKVSFIEGTYEVDMPEGCQFAFTINGVKNADGSGDISDVSCTWEIQDGMSGIKFDGNVEDVLTVKGYITAMAGRSFYLKAKVSWTTDNGDVYNRIYTIKLNSVDMTKFPLVPVNNQGSRERLPLLSPERLSLFMNASLKSKHK